LPPEVVTLVLRTAGENPRWGCVRICGKLGKLGIRVGATTIRTLLRRHELDPVPRCCGPTWTQFLNAQVKGIVACDFLTVETIWLQTLSVLFFMHVSTRQVVVAGVTASPDSAWVTRQARNATMDLNDRQLSVRFMLRDHDAKFTGGFDEVFRGEGAAAIRRPIRAPKANAHAERWVQTVRSERLDWTLVLVRRQLLLLLRVYARHYNERRPHRALALATPKRGNSVQRTSVAGDQASRGTQRPHPRVSRTRSMTNHNIGPTGWSMRSSWRHFRT
jgi:putative transposase